MNALEQQVMEFVLRGEHPFLEILREQLTAASVASREHTGVGFSTDFNIPDNVRRLPSAKGLVISDVHGEITGLQHGAGFLVFVEKGILSMLEGYCYEDEWPTDTQICRLYYVHRFEPGSSSLVETKERDFVFAMN